MPEYVTRPDRKVGTEPKSVIKYFDRLHQQGLSQREIASRFDLGRSTVGDYLKGKYSPSRGRAKELAETINSKNAEGAFSMSLPTARAKTVTLEPINKAARTSAREYREEILKLARGEEYDLSKFEGKSIRVRGKKGIMKFTFVVNEDILNTMAKQGQLSELKMFRNRGS